MIDRQLVTRKLALIASDLKALAPIAAKPVDEYLASEADEVLVERGLVAPIRRLVYSTRVCPTRACIFPRTFLPVWIARRGGVG